MYVCVCMCCHSFLTLGVHLMCKGPLHCHQVRNGGCALCGSLEQEMLYVVGNVSECNLLQIGSTLRFH